MRLTLRMAVIVVAACGMAWLCPAQNADRTEIAFQAAMKKETVDGDIKGALEAYKKLAQSRDQTIAAKALVRMGECYEKLGDAEARKAYERVVREFGSQKESVAAARARLAALGKNAGSGDMRAIRQLHPDRDIWFLGPSPDGSHLLQQGPKREGLTLRTLATGKMQSLTNRGVIWRAAFSRDGRQVAYALWEKGEASGLWTVGVDGTRDRMLLSREKSGVIDNIVGWSPDGGQIVLQTEGGKDDPHKLVAVSTADSTVTTLREGLWIADPELSPDGRYVVCRVRVQQNPAQDEIRLFSLTDRSDMTLLRDKTAAEGPRWTADGSGILYLSDQRAPGRNWDLWLLRISGGKPQDRPELVKTALASSSYFGNGAIPLGSVTRDGTYFYLQQTPTFEVGTVALDPTTGKAVGAFSRVQHEAGQSYNPSVSRDGRRMAYLRDTGQGFSLVTQSLETGKETSVSTAFHRSEYTDWFPDGRAVLVHAVHAQDGAGIYRVDVATGATTLLKAGAFGAWVELSSDGKTAFISRLQSKSNQAKLFAWNLETGEEKELLTAQANGSPGGVRFFLSPDKTQLAYQSFKEGQSIIALMPVAGGDGREILRTRDDLPLAGWSSDGKHVLIGRPGGTEQAQQWELQQLSVADGTRQDIGVTAGGLRSAVMSPDGRRMFLGTPTVKYEVWSLENFLPKSPSH